MSGRVAVLVPHAGHTEHLIDCLHSLNSDLVEQTYVVLPAAAHASLRIIARHANATAITTSGQASFAHATNLAAAVATADLLLLLNDDASAHNGALEALVRFMDDHPDVSIAGPRLLNPDGSIQPSVYADPSWRGVAELMFGPIARRISRRRMMFPSPHASDAPVRADWVSGAACLVRRRLYESVGGLDEEFPHGLEDAALCLAARATGGSVMLVPAARFTHVGGASGFRHATRGDAVARALTSGYLGWMRYWRFYRRASRLDCAALKLCFIAIASSRLIAFTLARAARPADAGLAVRARAYRSHLRGLFGHTGSAEAA